MSRWGVERLQPLGRALMLPIAVLPIAGLLLRLGQPDLLGIPFVAASGDAIFANLGLLFAIGVAVGLARENHGAAGLAGAVAYLVTIEGAKVLLDVPADVTAAFADRATRDMAAAAFKAKQMARLSVPAGIVAGLTAGWLYNRYATIKLPEYLAFFGGRRFVAIAAGGAGLVGALLFGLGFPALATGIDAASRWVVGAGGIGLFVYGLLNRLLIVTGLHHILNNLVWFIVGDFNGATGDLKRFFAGDPTAGAFMAGYFPVMMFGLPAACLAMYRSAAPARRPAVAGLFLSLGLTSFLTGVTEPIEFTFMFLAPVLYVLHAVLTGVSMVLMDWLGVRLGFGFSAGLFDYLLGYGLATRPLLLLPVGAAYGAIYYGTFAYVIRRFDLQTPGREKGDRAVAAPVAASARAGEMIAALGGAENLRGVDACTTRLRLTLVDSQAIDEPRLRAIGARGVVRPGGDALQVVLGPIADQVAGEIRDALAQPLPEQAPRPERAASPERTDFWSALMGGAANIQDQQLLGSRVRVVVRDAALIDRQALIASGVRGISMPLPDTVHLLVEPACR